LTAVAVRTEGRVYLFDCGEGTQVPYKERHLGQRALRLIAITHLHADHCLGLPGLLMLRAQMPDPGPLAVLGPPGLARFIGHVREDLALYINYQIQVHEWRGEEDRLAYEDDLVRISWRPLAHSVLCLGYRLEERERPGKFDAEEATRLGIPFGPHRGALQAGRGVTLADGTLIRPEQVLGPTRRGRHLAFITDTTLTPNLGPLLHDVDLAFLEGMFLPEHLEEALEKKHLTVEQGVRAAREAGAHRVRLVHVSPRYDRADLARLNDAANPLHPRARLAREGEIIAVPLPDDDESERNPGL
jgi:ribonuclease Z